MICSSRMEEGAWSRKCRIFKVSGSFSSGRSRKTWNGAIRSNLKERNADKDTAKDRTVWKCFI